MYICNVQYQVHMYMYVCINSRFFKLKKPPYFLFLLIMYDVEYCIIYCITSKRPISPKGRVDKKKKIKLNFALVVKMIFIIVFFFEQNLLSSSFVMIRKVKKRKKEKKSGHVTYHC